MMDIEFASGTAVTFELKQPQKQEDGAAVDRRRVAGSRPPATTCCPRPTCSAVGADGTTWEVDHAQPRQPSRSAAPSLAGPGRQPQGRAAEHLQASRARTSRRRWPTPTDAPVVIPLTGDNLNPEPTQVARRRRPARGAGSTPAAWRSCCSDLDPPLSPNEITDRVNAADAPGADAAQARSAATRRRRRRDFTVVAADGAAGPADRPPPSC